MVSDAGNVKRQLLDSLYTAFEVSPSPQGRDSYAINGELRIIILYSKGTRNSSSTGYFFGINPNIGDWFDPDIDLLVFVCGDADRLLVLPLRHVQELTIEKGTYKLHISIPNEQPDASYLLEDPERRSLVKFQHDRISLSALISDYLESLLSQKTVGQRDASPDEVYLQTDIAIHDELKSKLVTMGNILGMFAKAEYAVDGFRYDVVWKEREDFGVRKAFEIQHRGSVDSALIKLKHAHDMWRSDLFLIITGEKDIEKAKKLLAPRLYGAFHEISHTKVIGPDAVRELHEAVTRHEQSVRLLLKK